MLSRVIYYDDSVLSSIHAALRKWHNWSFHGCSTAGATVLCVLPSRTVQKFWVQVQQFKRWPFYPSSSVGVAVTRRTMANYCCPFFFSFINHCIANTTISSFIMFFCLLYYTLYYYYDEGRPQCICSTRPAMRGRLRDHRKHFVLSRKIVYSHLVKYFKIDYYVPRWFWSKGTCARLVPWGIALDTVAGSSV